MTMLSFWVAENLARDTRAWADELGVDRSEILREALRRELVRLAGERDSLAWAFRPLAPEEQALDASGTWGPPEDWSHWEAAPHEPGVRAAR